ncbi:hypothetical protein ACVMGC_003953 [Bradyrhizobium barranii subsp. barranii]|uniref:phytochelatin synthase family protein n=1 Tax=Bradyrhizobium liaoningense TaxID=43992 RepID=UPI002010D560|nr:phytochelatin synthase family protein [Bradyrhizobium liaoningense]
MRPTTADDDVFDFDALLHPGTVFEAPRDVLDHPALTLSEKRAILASWASDASPELIERAWHLPVAATFQRHVDWQSNGSRCGPAAVANAYRSLGEAAATEGKVLAGTWSCWTGVCIMGLTLDELARVAQTNTSRKVTVLRDLSEDQFLEHLRRSNDPGRRYVVNFDRARVFGAGSGHHSPIGGYLEAEDLVFVLDVNFNFQPWLEVRRPEVVTD